MHSTRTIPKRSFTSNHTLLPASRPISEHGSSAVNVLPSPSLLTWMVGRGSVIWRIWPAVVLHTTFAACVVNLDMRKIVNLEIPNIMLTVLGVVIGFVISYRASTGYDRYWTGRTCWSDVIRNSRTLGRLVWFHVPLRIAPKPCGKSEGSNSDEELVKRQVMGEKRLALDLIEGFAVALKHHIRGELGIYYEDLYHLLKPMHGQAHDYDNHESIDAQPQFEDASSTALPVREAQSCNQGHTSQLASANPIIPAINDYGTFDFAAHSSRSPSPSPAQYPFLRGRPFSAKESQHRHFMPSAQPQPTGIVHGADGDLIPFPFSGLFKRIFSSRSQSSSDAPPRLDGDVNNYKKLNGQLKKRRWQGPTFTHPALHSKHRPKVAGGGENLPLEILRCLSEWLSVLEDRGCIPGSSMGPMIASISAFEESLTALERILTTPLPFVYAVHISTVWLYLFFLPFQLVSLFGYYTIPGVAIASFIYLGFLAAGEEIEQPFGYDDNDLDLDLFCHSIIHADIQQLKRTRCLNTYFELDVDPASLGKKQNLHLHVSGSTTPRRSLTLSETSSLHAQISQAEN